METRETDLSDSELMEFVRMYEQGQTFICGGRKVDPYRISEIKIHRTQEKARNIVLGSGEDVTRQFIKRPPPRIETPSVSKKKISSVPSSKNVFIVHGRDYKPMKELKAMLKGFGLNPIVLHEQPSGSRTIVEKLEKYSDVGFAFVILTPDDVGTLSLRYTRIRPEFYTKRPFYSLLDFKPRARQNVVLEFGYFIGLLSRDRVCCLHTGDVELPSDMHGIVYIPFKDSVNEVRDEIIKELKEADYESTHLG